MLTEETVLRGTGILTRVYRLYRLDGFRIVRIWEVESFQRLAPMEGGDQLLMRSHIRCEPSGGGQRVARLLLLTETLAEPEAPVVTRRAFSLSGGHVSEAPW